MALKKKKSKKKQSPQEKIRNLIRNPATWLVAFVLLFATYHYGSIWIEKRQFEKLDKQAYQYIQSIARIYPGKITKEQYCDYSSAKYSKGSLGCNVNYKLEIDAIRNDNVQFENTLVAGPWEHYSKGKSYTGNSADSRNTVYLFDRQKNCSVATYYSGMSLLVSAGCSGNARAEHYPVREY